MRTTTLAVLAALTLCATVSRAQDTREVSRYYEDARRYYAQDRLDEALIQLKNALQIDNQNVPALLLLGDLSALQGNVLVAEQSYADGLLLGASPSTVVPKLADVFLIQGAYGKLVDTINAAPLDPRARGEVLAYQAIAHRQLGNPQKARALLDEARALADGTRAVGLARTEQALADGDIDTALQLSNALLDQGTNDGSLFSVRARVLSAAGRTDEAAEAFDRAIELNPRLAPARLGRASLSLTEGNLEYARADAEFLTDSYPGDPRAWFLLGRTRERLGQRDEAIQAFENSLSAISRMDGDTVAQSKELTLLAASAGLLANAENRVLQILTAYQARHPTEIETGLLLARLLLDAGEAADVLRVTEPMQRAYPDDLKIGVMRAEALAALGRNREAAAIWRQINREHSHFYAASSIARNELLAGELDEGTRRLEALVADNPRAEQETYHLASAYLSLGRLAEAEALAVRLLELRDDTWQYTLLRAQCLIGLGRPAEAERMLTEVRDRSPANSDIRVAIARAQRLQGKLDEARTSLQAQSDAPVTEAGLERALIERSAGNLAEARRLAEQTQSAAPEHVGAARVLADILLALEKPADAVTLTRQLAGRRRESLPAQLLHAETLASAGLRSDAVAQYKLLSRDADLSHRVLYEIASAQAALGALEDASAVLFRAQRLAPDERAYQTAAVDIALRLGNADNAQKAAGDLVERYPGHAPAYVLRARTERTAGRFRDAAASLARAQQLRPDSNRICIERYQTLRQAGETAQAAQILVDWLRTHPDDPLIAFARATDLLGANRAEEARELLVPLATRSPDNPAILNNLAVAETRLGLDSAIDTARRALAAAPDSARVNDTLGWALSRAGEHAAALPYLREAAARSGPSPELRYHLGATLYAMGRIDEARAELRWIVDSPVDFVGREQALRLLDNR